MQVTFDTYIKYRAGELVEVNFPNHGIKEQMLVAEVNIKDIGSVDNRLLYTVRLVSGESFGGWVNFFKKLAEHNKTFVIRENEVVVKMLTRDEFQKQLLDSMTYKLHGYLVCNIDIFCGEEVII